MYGRMSCEQPIRSTVVRDVSYLNNIADPFVVIFHFVAREASAFRAVSDMTPGCHQHHPRSWQTHPHPHVDAAVNSSNGLLPSGSLGNCSTQGMASMTPRHTFTKHWCIRPRRCATALCGSGRCHGSLQTWRVGVQPMPSCAPLVRQDLSGRGRSGGRLRVTDASNLRKHGPQLLHDVRADAIQFQCSFRR